MNSKDWLKKYYPVPVTKSTKRMSKRNAILHSIKKWEGLHKTVLKKYGLHKKYAEIRDRQGNVVIKVTTSTCALCEKFFDYSKANYEFDDGCIKCPIYQKIGRSCSPSQADAEYISWKRDGDARPMIRLLKSLLEE